VRISNDTLKIVPFDGFADGFFFGLNVDIAQEAIPQLMSLIYNNSDLWPKASNCFQSLVMLLYKVALR
jgi:hypothetical protein